MAFDVNNPAHLATLKSLVPNPSLGTDVILASLNDYYDTNGDALYPANTGPAQLTTRSLLEMVFGINISSGDQWRIQLIFEMTDGERNIDDMRPMLNGINNALDTAIENHTRPLSLAEINFSNLDEYGAQEVVNITRTDWFAARSST